jgi:small subunit ribosomal protein S6
MAFYEHVFLARQDVTPQQVQALIKTYQGVIEEAGGTVGKTEYWGLKSLAYKIKKNRKAHYALMNINAPHAAVAEMERQMRISGDIIRFMTIRVDELDEKPSAPLRRSEERERGDRDFRSGDRGERGDRGDRGERADRGERRGPRRDATRTETASPGEGNY